MLITIETRYIGPTDYRPSRIVAETCNGQRLVMSYSTASDLSNNGELGAASRVVAQALADKMNWGPLGDGGVTKRGHVFLLGT